MKIIKKRVLALLVDSFILGSIIAILQLIFPDLFLDNVFWACLIVVPFVCRDFVFRNASIGKKLFGIAIYDKNWKKPTFILLLKRSFLTATVGYVLAWKYRFIDGNTLLLIDWERETLGTMVIDKKVYNELSFTAEQNSGDFAKNMTELYNEYLRRLYSK